MAHGSKPPSAAMYRVDRPLVAGMVPKFATAKQFDDFTANEKNGLHVCPTDQPFLHHNRALRLEPRQRRRLCRSPSNGQASHFSLSASLRIKSSLRLDIETNISRLLLC